MAGQSWEGFVIEQIIGAAPPLAEFSFYRTAAGAEMDIVVTVGGRSVGYEIKLSNAPKPGKGFWHACEDLAWSVPTLSRRCWNPMRWPTTSRSFRR